MRNLMLLSLVLSLCAGASGATNPFLFKGMTYDAEIGSYAGHRQYDPGLKRTLQPRADSYKAFGSDPLGGDGDKIALGNLVPGRVCFHHLCYAPQTPAVPPISIIPEGLGSTIEIPPLPEQGQSGMTCVEADGIYINGQVIKVPDTCSLNIYCTPSGSLNLTCYCLIGDCYRCPPGFNICKPTSECCAWCPFSRNSVCARCCAAVDPWFNRPGWPQNCSPRNDACRGMNTGEPPEYNNPCNAQYPCPVWPNAAYHKWLADSYQALPFIDYP